MVVVLDGGLASTLQASGHEVDGHPLWSAKLLHDNPGAIVEAHAKFIEAGADVLITASYQVFYKFLKYLGCSHHSQFSGMISLSSTWNVLITASYQVW